MKRAAVFTDISGVGNCSGSTNISILSHMGAEVCLIPTAVLSAQTGFNDCYIYDFTENLSSYIKSIELIDVDFDAIYVGFIANSAQAKIVSDFISRFKRNSTIVFTDPIMGDNGKIHGFFTEELCSNVSRIVALSDIITPNLTELCFLTETSYDFVNSLSDKEKFEKIYLMCQKLFDNEIKTVIVTGIGCENGKIANMSADKSGYKTIITRKAGGSYSGTGDIFASIVLGSLLNGCSCYESVKKAAEFVTEVLINSYESIKDRNYGIPYQQFLSKLL